MKKNTFITSIMTVAALSATGSVFLAQTANANPHNPMMMADTGMDMKSMNMDGMKSMRMEATPVTHHGTGTVKKIDAKMVTLSHGPITSLNWSAMTMSFKLKDAALARGIKVGDVIDFELVQSGGNYVVTRLQLSGK